MNVCYNFFITRILLERARGPEAHIWAVGPAVFAGCGPSEHSAFFFHITLIRYLIHKSGYWSNNLNIISCFVQIVWQLYKKAKTIEKPSKVDFTGAAVPLSGTLKFGGAGPVGPLRAMINKRPGYYVHSIDQQTNQPTDMTCYRHARKHKSSHGGLGRRRNAKNAWNSQMWQTDQRTYWPT